MAQSGVVTAATMEAGTMPAVAIETALNAEPLDAERLEQLTRRRAVGAIRFVYGVRSTGIYCRSDCPSRRPHPSQIVFFDSPREAVVSGFRACRRCHPEKGLAYSAPLEAVEKACRLIDRVGDRRWSLVSIARQVGYSPSHFQRVFTGLLGVSPKQYFDAVRVNRFRDELRRGRSVRAATYAAGRRSLSWPYAPSTGLLGMDAGRYRRGGANERIGHVVVSSPLGPILVAATPRGVCFVAFGDSEVGLIDRLRREFPRAELRPSGPSSLRRWAGEIVASIEEGGRSLADIPTDLRATTFQARVWHAIRTIAQGETRSYSDLARELGAPSAARSVARACATNPVALVVPCHRVRRQDGTLGGYRWGLDRKRRLLETERGEGRDVRTGQGAGGRRRRPK